MPFYPLRFFPILLRRLRIFFFLSDSGTGTTDSTEKTQRNKTEVFTATDTAVEGILWASVI